MRAAPPVMFLGLCERAAHVRDRYVNLAKWNLLGLKSVVFAPVYPLSLRGSSFVMGIYAPSAEESLEVLLRDAQGKEWASCRVAVSSADPKRDPVESPAEIILNGPATWLLAIAPADAGGRFIPAPGLYTVYVRIDGEECAIGGIDFEVEDPLPLTPERIAAIKADPQASKLVRVKFHCNTCGGGQQPYAALDRDPQLEAEGYVWYRDLPDDFTCSCGAYSLDLRTVRRNLHGLLGRTRIPVSKALSVPLYEKGVIDSVRIELAALVRLDPEEEAIQRFFVANPLVLHMFYPQKLFPKAPILTKYKTDFVICTASRELILVELETASRRLMKADGGLSSEVQHAFDQVHDWLNACDEHRSAVIDCIGLRPEEVASIRGVVIAGRDTHYDFENLRRLKAKDFGRIKLFTYDDVLGTLDALGNHLIASAEREADNSPTPDTSAGHLG